MVNIFLLIIFLLLNVNGININHNVCYAACLIIIAVFSKWLKNKYYKLYGSLNFSAGFMSQ